MSEPQKPVNICEGRVIQAFATPITAFHWPESEALNAELGRAVLAREAEAAGKGVVRSNIGGWHSGHDLLDWGGGAIDTLHKRMLRMAADLTAATLRGPKELRMNFLVEAWANVSRRGQYHRVHDHATSHWSGVYYVSTGQPDPDVPHNGQLEFIDPRGSVGMLPPPQGSFESRNAVDAEPGLMVMFPSWLRHQVHPFSGEGERISIAFNVRLRHAQGQTEGGDGT